MLNATGEERSAIIACAREAGLSVCAYILRRALQAPVSPRQDWQRIVRQQALLLRQLDEIAAALVTSEPVRDVGAALLALRRIEAELSNWGSGSNITPESEYLGDEDLDGEIDDSGDESAVC